VLVVLGAEFQKLPRRFHVVQVSMEVGEEYCDLVKKTGKVAPIGKHQQIPSRGPESGRSWQYHNDKKARRKTGTTFFY
jgi:hypothetical protein